MTTITIEIPQKTVKKHRQNIVAYKKVQEPSEEAWIDIDVEPKMSLEDFYQVVKSYGTKVA